MYASSLNDSLLPPNCAPQWRITYCCSETIQKDMYLEGGVKEDIKIGISATDAGDVRFRISPCQG